MSIAKKVTLVVALLAGLLLVSSGYVGYVYRVREIEDRVQQDSRLLAQVVKVTVESSLENYGQMGAIEDLVSRAMPMRLVFYGRDGRAVAPVPTEEEPVVSHRARRVMDRNRPEEQTAPGGYIYRVPLIDKSNRKVAGCLELSIDLDAIVNPQWQHWAMGIGGGMLLVFALGVGLFSRGAIQRPIKQLMEGMDHVIRGDLTHALPLDRNDEIGRIAYRFNEMTAQLRDAQQEIHRSAEAKLKLEQSLRQSEKLATIGQLSAEIAHEVGTPLNVIGGRARSLERKGSSPAVVTKNARIIADQAGRITKIIQQMLDLSRARIPEKGPVDLARTVGEVLTLLEYEIERESVEVVLTLPADLPLVNGDTDGLQQVFINLIHNAVQAMPGGGILNISARAETRRKEGLDLAPPQQYVAMEIGDTGKGIPEERQKQVFEPFYSTKRKGEGTGLGLTVVQGIVKEHDGWIELGSGSPSQGTVFRIFLPATAVIEGGEVGENGTEP